MQDWWNTFIVEWKQWYWQWVQHRIEFVVDLFSSFCIFIFCFIVAYFWPSVQCGGYRWSVLSASSIWKYIPKYDWCYETAICSFTGITCFRKGIQILLAVMEVKYSLHIVHHNKAHTHINITKLTTKSFYIVPIEWVGVAFFASISLKSSLESPSYQRSTYWKSCIAFYCIWLEVFSS